MQGCPKLVRLHDDGAKKGKVMKELLMMKGAKTLVDVATKVQPGDTVLLVTVKTEPRTPCGRTKAPQG